jgi:hypothetical protein
MSFNIPLIILTKISRYKSFDIRFTGRDTYDNVAGVIAMNKDTITEVNIIYLEIQLNRRCLHTAGNRHKQNSWFCKEIREDNFRFWWRRVHEDASQGMYMSKFEIFFFTARILQNQRMLCCGECFHD